MILLRIIQAAFLVYLAVIVFTFFKDYVRNKETDYPRRTNLINYAFGFINYVLDALGIGSFAPLMAYYKLTKSVPDMLIPGTMSIGAAIPTILEAFLFMQVIEVLKDYQSSDEFINRREEVIEITGGQELSEFQATDVIDLRVRYGTRLNFHWLCIKASGAWYYDEESDGINDALLLVADYDTGKIYDRFTVPESWNIEPKSPDDETEEWQMYTFITSGPIAGSEKYDGGSLFFEERQNEAKTIFSEEDIAEINEAIRQ